MPLDAQLLTLLAYVTLLALFVSAVVIGLKRTAQRFEIRRIELAALRRAARTPADRFLPEDQARFPLLHPVGIGLALSCGLGLAHYTPLAPVIHRATTDAGLGASGFRLVFQLALVVMVLWAHRPAPEQGLRILHRSTVRGVAPLAPRPALPQFVDIHGPNPAPPGGWHGGGVGFRWEQGIPMRN